VEGVSADAPAGGLSLTGQGPGRLPGHTGSGQAQDDSVDLLRPGD